MNKFETLTEWLKSELEKSNYRFSGFQGAAAENRGYAKALESVLDFVRELQDREAEVESAVEGERRWYGESLTTLLDALTATENLGKKSRSRNKK